MACRCGDIAVCRADERLLSQSSFKTAAMYVSDNVAELSVGIVEESTRLAMLSDNMEEAAAAITGTAENLASEVDALVNKMKNAGQAVTDRIALLQQEDTAYHLEEERRIREEERRRQEAKRKVTKHV